MNGSLVSFGFAGLLGMAILAGCSSSSSSSTPTGTYCDLTVAGSEICSGYTNLTADQVKSVTDSCTQQGGKIVSSCPSANQSGCCSFTSSGYTVNACYYCPTDATTGKTACTAQSGATWTDGSATCGGGDGGTTGDGGSTGDSGSTTGDAAAE